MNKGKKFDICLMNPPYASGMHIDFLSKISKISNNYISIQPISFLQKHVLYNEPINEDIKLNNIEIIDIPKAQKLFPLTNIRSDLGIISYLEKFNNIELKDINLFNINEKEIIYKCINYVKNNNSLDSILSKKQGDGLLLKFSNGATLYGNGKITTATFRVNAMNYKIATSKEKVGHIIYMNNIPDENIRKNIYDFYGFVYLRYWIYKCCLAESKYKFIPFLNYNYFKNKWNDNDYKEFFINKIGLTEKEWIYYYKKSNELPDYYNIRHENSENEI